MNDPTSGFHDLQVARDGSVVTVTFNRPAARNAMTWGMYERLQQACEEADADDSVRVLVLRGAGGKAFVSGTYISQFKEGVRAFLEKRPPRWRDPSLPPDPRAGSR